VAVSALTLLVVSQVGHPAMNSRRQFSPQLAFSFDAVGGAAGRASGL